MKLGGSCIYKYCVFYISFILVLSSLLVLVNAEENETIIVDYFFEKPSIRVVTIEGIEYDEIFLKDASAYGHSGEPSLPVVGAYIMIPAQETVEQINVVSSGLQFLGSGFTIVPMATPAPLSQLDAAFLPEPDPTVYSSDTMIPGTMHTEINTYTFRGYEILVLMLHPVQYVPSSGSLYYYPDLTVSVQTTNDASKKMMFRGLEIDKKEAAAKVDNYGIADSYDLLPRSQNVLDSYELLIITTDELKTGFVPLKQAHDAEGTTTVISTVSEIGSSNPDDLRQYIRDAYLNHSIQYVLIGGDDDIIPAKDLYVRSWSGSGASVDRNMPVDLYFGCLDGTYNFDGDEYWGEPYDGPNGGDVDLLAEVYVGRACVGDLTEVGNFVDKTLDYMNTDLNDIYLQKAVMVGEHLWSKPDTWGGDYMDELVDGSNSNMYTTVGIPSDRFVIDKLYDKDWDGNDWAISEITDRIDSNVHLVNHLGHGNTHHALKMENYHADALVNDKYCFVYSQACYAGQFDNADGFAEHMTIKTNHAAFAVIMNARYGWGSKGSTNGPSQHYHRQFLDAVFGEDIKIISKANQDSKEDNLYRINGSCMRWCYYELNLFGDPAVAFYNDIEKKSPHKPMEPDGPSNGEKYEDLTFTTRADDPNLDLLYFKWSWGDGSESNWTGPFRSGQKVAALHSWNTTGTYEITAIVKDTEGLMSEWSDPTAVQIQGVDLAIGPIQGGRDIRSSIINNGNIPAYGVIYTINIEGGLTLLGRNTFGMRSTVSDGGELVICSDPVFGLGNVKIRIEVEAPNNEYCVSSTDAFLFGPFVLIKNNATHNLQYITEVRFK